MLGLEHSWRGEGGFDDNEYAPVHKTEENVALMANSIRRHPGQKTLSLLRDDTAVNAVVILFPQ